MEGTLGDTRLYSGLACANPARDCERCRQPGVVSLAGERLCRKHSEDQLRQWAALSGEEAQALRAPAEICPPVVLLPDRLFARPVQLCNLKSVDA